jgi:hypothetical protein
LFKSKIDVESKEQTKIAYLREQANKRNTENLKTSQKEAIKEANKLVVFFIFHF